MTTVAEPVAPPRERTTPRWRPSADARWPIAGFVFVALVVLWLGHASHANLFGHTSYDSYTVEALAWRHGHVTVQNYAWLELAIYHGHYWVSFPPLPAVVMFPLTFIFGANTPSAGVSMVYFFAGLWAIYALMRRYRPAGEATLWMVFVALGGSLLGIAVGGSGTTGGVWFQAQLLAFFLTALAFLLVDGESKKGWVAGGVCIALAFACRPFNLIFAPVLLWMLLQHLGGDKKAVLPYLVPAGVVLAIIGIYNAARFGVPWEFGHKYLPEFTRAHQTMFTASKILPNIGEVLKPPTFVKGQLTFSHWGGFSIYLTNPMLLLGLGVLVVRGVRRKLDVLELLLLVTITVQALALLSHRTNGGWQYGTRYLVDTVPAITYVLARRGVRIQPLGAVLIGGLIAFNVIATAVFNTTP